MAKYTSIGAQVYEDDVIFIDCYDRDECATRLASLLNRAERMEAALKALADEVDNLDSDDVTLTMRLLDARTALSLEEQPT